MKIIEYVNILYDFTYPIFENFSTFSLLIHLSHYQLIQEMKYTDHGDKSCEYYGSNEISQNKQIYVQ